MLLLFSARCADALVLNDEKSSTARELELTREVVIYERICPPPIMPGISEENIGIRDIQRPETRDQRDQSETYLPLTLNA